MSSNLIFRQLFESISCTFTYILGCNSTKQALIIDPVLETTNRDLKLIRELGLNLVYGLNTHIHADHVTGTGQIKRSVNGFPLMKSVLSANAGAKAVDVMVKQYDVIKWGENNELEVRETPGHTNGCLTYVFHKHRMAFTGDALLIRGCGRTDFQQGNPHTLYNSVHKQILSLPSDYLLFPAHDYTGRMVTTVWEEKKFNPRLNKSEDEFVQIMNSLNLPYPKQIDKSMPANFLCGIYDLMDENLREQVFTEKENK
uniref:Persulfide dioxygenase ETHE1, mitochondrial n=1 Tax=Meloidogyne incognita TaxID=6306 RepID=A0A914L4H4_MELIC